MAVDLKKTAQSVIASILSSINPVAGAAAKAYNASPAHTGAWGTKDFGATEAAGKVLGANTTSQGGSNLFGPTSQDSWNKTYQNYNVPGSKVTNDLAARNMSTSSAYLPSGDSGGNTGSGDTGGGDNGGDQERMRQEAILNSIRRILAQRMQLAQEWLGRAKKTREQRGANIDQGYANQETNSAQNWADANQMNNRTARASNSYGSSIYDNAITSNNAAKAANLDVINNARLGEQATADDQLFQAEDQARQLEMSSAEQYGLDENAAQNSADARIAQIQAANQLLAANGVGTAANKSYTSMAAPMATTTDTAGNPVTSEIIKKLLQQRGYVA